MKKDGIDPRWAILKQRQWRCSRCEELHEGLIEFGASVPDHWRGSDELSPNSAVATSENFVSEDLCVIDNKDFFVRCILRLPLLRSGGDYYAYGVWSTLSKKNFMTYVEHFDSGTYDDAGWFGWFATGLPGYPETRGLKCNVIPQPGRQRPLIELQETDHPLYREQRDGIGYDRLLEIYALYGHEPDAPAKD
jgi:hypothetical protein